MRQFKMMLALGIVFLASIIIWIAHSRLDSLGVPIIREKIDGQLADLRLTTPSVGVFPVGDREGGKIVGDKAPFSGKFYYATKVDGASADLVVFWEGDSNACRISKIEVQGTSLAPRVIWQRKIN